jgi:plastocyanin
VVVEIRDSAFDPPSVVLPQLKRGDKWIVTFVNRDVKEHVVVLENFTSGPLKPGESWTHLFYRTGIFEYRSLSNPTMRGKIVAGPPPPTPRPVQEQPRVTIEGFAFDPPVLLVAAGAKVTWINKDNVEHTVTGEGFDSGLIKPGETWEYSFDRWDIFDYICAIHPYMKGTVAVVNRYEYPH